MGKLIQLRSHRVFSTSPKAGGYPMYPLPKEKYFYFQNYILIQYVFSNSTNPNTSSAVQNLYTSNVRASFCIPNEIQMFKTFTKLSQSQLFHHLLVNFLTWIIDTSTVKIHSALSKIKRIYVIVIDNQSQIKSLKFLE